MAEEFLFEVQHQANKTELTYPDGHLFFGGLFLPFPLISSHKNLHTYTNLLHLNTDLDLE